MASEILLIKSRALLDFLTKENEKVRSSDIHISDFGLSPVAPPSSLGSVRAFVGKRSAHLTWERARENLNEGPIQLSMPLHDVAKWILDVTCQFIDGRLATGMVLTQPRHRLDLKRLRASYERLRTVFAESGG